MTAPSPSLDKQVIRPGFLKRIGERQGTNYSGL